MALAFLIHHHAAEITLPIRPLESCGFHANGDVLRATAMTGDMWSTGKKKLFHEALIIFVQLSETQDLVPLKKNEMG